MTRIEDMSDMERQSWITLLADTAVFAYFVRKMTDGFGVICHTPEGLMKIYVTVIIMTVIIHAVISAIFAVRLKRDDHEVDERDRDIERRGERNGFWVFVIFVNIIIFTLLFENSYPNPKDYDPPFSVITPPFMFFALLATTFVADITKRASMIWDYRT